MGHRLAVLIMAIATFAGAQVQFNFRGSGQMTETYIDQALRFEVEVGGERLATLEQDLKDMFTSLPKNQRGLVGHQAVRYALHRYFLQLHGWFIRGLEPRNATWTPQRRPDGQLPPAFVKEWVATSLQDRLEMKEGNHGMDLHDMATMAATLEDLVKKEVEIRLKMVYDVNSISPKDTVSREKGADILDTYLMTFLLGNNLTAKSRKHMMLKKQIFAKKYKGYNEVHDWYSGTAGKWLDSKNNVDFQLASQVVQDLGDKFHTFNDIECNDLRATLNQAESRRQGRVRLSSFYNMSRFTHWRFTESADWLKSLGALDDSDSKNPSVIIPNYVMARPNCLEASNLYAVCCRNTCEDLMAHLEREIGHAKTTSAHLTELVAALPSETVRSPRELPQALLDRLDQVAAHHNGEVPLHGRLFAQWMHHAFPRECPYPHEAGTVNPQTSDEWMRESGQMPHATEEEMHEHIQNDVCALNWEGNPDCDHEGTELPWSPVEELLSATKTSDPLRGSGDAGIATLEQESMFVFALVGLVITVPATLLVKRRVSVQPRVHTVLLDGKSLGLVAVLSVVSLAYSVDLLDGSVFGLALSASFVFYAASILSDRASAHGDRKACLPKAV